MTTITVNAGDVETDPFVKVKLEVLLPAIDSDIAWERGCIKQSKERLTLLKKRKAEVVAALKTLYPEPEAPKGILSEEHRDRKWVDPQGWVFTHQGEGHWVARKSGHGDQPYEEPFGLNWESPTYSLKEYRPRVWNMPNQVPKDVRVIDANGREFTRQHSNEFYYLWPVSGTYTRPVAPYTEVLEAGK